MKGQYRTLRVTINCCVTCTSTKNGVRVRCVKERLRESSCACGRANRVLLRSSMPRCSCRSQVYHAEVKAAASRAWRCQSASQVTQRPMQSPTAGRRTIPRDTRTSLWGGSGCCFCSIFAHTAAREASAGQALWCSISDRPLWFFCPSSREESMRIDIGPSSP